MIKVFERAETGRGGPVLACEVRHAVAQGKLLVGGLLPADIGDALSRSDIPRDRGKCRFLGAACTQGSRIVETSELFGQGSTEVVARDVPIEFNLL